MHKRRGRVHRGGRSANAPPARSPAAAKLTSQRSAAPRPRRRVVVVALFSAAAVARPRYALALVCRSGRSDRVAPRLRPARSRGRRTRRGRTSSSGRGARGKTRDPSPPPTPRPRTRDSRCVSGRSHPKTTSSASLYSPYARAAAARVSGSHARIIASDRQSSAAVGGATSAGAPEKPRANPRAPRRAPRRRGAPGAESKATPRENAFGFPVMERWCLRYSYSPTTNPSSSPRAMASGAPEKNERRRTDARRGDSPRRSPAGRRSQLLRRPNRDQADAGRGRASRVSGGLS